MFEIEVTNNRASTKHGELLTYGQVGAQVQFTFNDHWTNMKKIAVFKRCGKTIDVMDSKWNGDIVTVPPEMTEEAGLLVHVGVYGVSDDGKRITPTLYAPLGAVALGAEPDGDPSTDPTLPVWAQILEKIGDLSNLATEDKTSLVAAINETAKSGGGKDGTGIASITYKGEDEFGGNMYTVLLTDGTSYDITAPKGAKGDPGPKGDKGADGKSAYQYAQDGGYTGTETEFAKKLASGALIVHVTVNNGTLSADKSFFEIRDAILAGTTVLVDYDSLILPFTIDGVDFLRFGTTRCDNAEEGASAVTIGIEIKENGEVNDISASILGAQEPLIGSIDDIKPSQVYVAVYAGRPVILNSGFHVYTAFSVSPFVVLSSIISDNAIYWLMSDDTDTWKEGTTEIPTEIPTALPNPNALTFTGAVTGSYDGSAPLTVNIPIAVTDDHINSLIDAKLGAIKNGSY